MYVYKCTCLYTWMSVSEINIEWCPLTLSTIFFWNRVRHWTWSSRNWPGCLVSKLQRSTYLYLPCSGIRGMHNHVQLFICMLGISTSKDLIDWVGLLCLPIRKPEVMVSVSFWHLLILLWACSHFTAQKIVLTNLVLFSPLCLVYPLSLWNSGSI